MNPLSNPAQANWPGVVNENFDALPNQVYAYDYLTSTGLTWGYFGGRWGDFAVAASTLTLTNTADNHIVVLRSSGAISVSTSTTNWNDTTAYARVFKVTTAGGAVTAVEDHRSGPSGVHGSAATAGAGTELKGLRFTSDTGSTADSDPGAGLFKWNHATQGSATKLFIDNSTEDGVSLATYLASLGQAGEIFIQQSDDANRWQLWRWTAVTDDTGYRDFTVTLQAKSTSDIEDGKVCYFDFEEDDTGSGGTTGKHMIPVMAGSMAPSASGGCAALATVAGASGQPDYVTLDFDGTAQEHAQFSIAMPKSWDEGTLSFKAHWSHASGSGDVIWGLQAVAVSNDDTIAANFGTAQEVTDTGGTANDLYTSSESSAITVGGSPAAEDVVFFRLYRKAADGGDTLNGVDARLHGISLFYTTNAENDA